MDRAQHLAWILAALVSVCIQQPFVQLSIALDTLRSADGQSTASWPRPRIENVACQHFFCVHSATLDQKNPVHIYPRTYLQLYIST